MHYKTMALELLQESFPSLYENLRARRRLLKALDRYSSDFKASHERRKEELSHSRPQSHPSQIASEALEIAIEDLRGRFLAEQSQDSTSEKPLSRDANLLNRRCHPSQE